MEEPKVKGKEIYDTYFTTNAIGLHTCKDCHQVLKQNVTRGYANLVSHVTTMHKDDFVEKVRRHVGGALAGAMD